MARLTDEIEQRIERFQRPSQHWKQIPLTVGLLTALIAGILGVWRMVGELDAIVLRSIEGHNHNTVAHDDLRTDLRDLQRRVDDRTERLQLELQAIRVKLESNRRRP